MSSAAPAIGTRGEVQFSVRTNGGPWRSEWRPGYEVTEVLAADDRPFRLTVRKEDRHLEGIAPECFRQVQS